MHSANAKPKEFENNPLIQKLREKQRQRISKCSGLCASTTQKVIWTPHVVECNALIDYLLKNFPDWVHWLPMKFPDDPEAPLGMLQYVGKTAVEHQRDLALKAYDDDDIGLSTQHLERLGIIEHHGRHRDRVQASV